MDRSHGTKGKKRARGNSIASDTRPSSSLSPVPDDHPPSRVKKPKRAETRPCPACSELIPIRLLAAHAELEMQRVETIIKHIGDAEVLAEVDDLEEGSSTNKRRSALKARRSLTALQPLPRIRTSSSDLPTILANTSITPAAIEHAIGHILRRRRARHARLKELAKEEATWLARQGASDVRETTGIVCPVCSQPARGDRDVVEAHVDACLAYETQRAQVERERERTIQLARGDEDADVDVDVGVNTGWDASVRTRVITDANLRGTGVHIRPSTLDTEDDIDIDGTDDAVFGDAQFGERDILRVELEADVGADEIGSVSQYLNHDRRSQNTTPTDVSSASRPRGSDEDMDKLDLAILTARSRGDSSALIAALEAKLNAIPPQATCRICLSPYVDPTVSTGCWHTCCATCWLRCLGATKLCPMCQRITGASELRRVYL